MPLGAPMPKLVATRAYGAHVEQVGRTIDDCLVRAREFAAETGAVLIHPFDHPDIVAGQGTCGLEILEQCPDVAHDRGQHGRRRADGRHRDRGQGQAAGRAGGRRPGRDGGGLPGVAGRRRARAAGPDEHDGRRHRGRAARRGALRASCASSSTASTTVSEESLSRALLFLPRAGQAGRRAGRRGRRGAPARRPAARLRRARWSRCCRGGNIDPVLLLRIIRHGMAAAGRYLQFRVRVPDRPGSLARLLADLAEADANVLEVEHVRTGAHAARRRGRAAACSWRPRARQHCEALLATLRGKGYDLVFA